MKKLKSFTIIEGIVSMVLLSIVLSVTVLISFNLYKSFPAQHQQFMRSVLTQQMDSIIQSGSLDNLEYAQGGYYIEYQSEQAAELKNMRLAKGVISDSLGHVWETKKLFVHYE